MHRGAKAVNKLSGVLFWMITSKSNEPAQATSSNQNAPTTVFKLELEEVWENQL